MEEDIQEEKPTAEKPSDAIIEAWLVEHFHNQGKTSFEYNDIRAAVDKLKTLI